MLFLLDSLHCLKWVIFLLKLNFCSKTGERRCVILLPLYFSSCCLLFTIHMTNILASLWTDALLYFWNMYYKSRSWATFKWTTQAYSKAQWRICFPPAIIMCHLNYPQRNGTYCLKYYSLILLLYKSALTFPFT